MKPRRFLSGILALALTASLPMSALAADWYLENGDITVSADSSGQSVSQGSGAAVADDAPVIKQRDSDTATDSTITISTSDGATANVTIEDVNISSSGDAIDVGSSSAKIALEGDNKIFSESGSALHISGGDVTIDGDGTLEAGIRDELSNDYNHNAKIGSHEHEDMSGTIHITGDATVTTDDKALENCGGDGAGIGSGEEGNMKGTIIIDENAHVEAVSNDRGAGIGSGDDGSMSGKIMIGGNAHVSAIGSENSAGIGSGDDGDFTGSVTIDGNANVTAKAGGDQNGNDGSGIGSGDDGRFSGTVTIGGSATVVAAGSDEGCGIGSSDGRNMGGTILIRDHAKVTAYGGECGAAIGAEDRTDMTGKIIIIGSAIISTGVVDEKGNVLSDRIGYIGDGQDPNHESEDGHYIIGPDVTINGLNGSDIDALKKYINMHLSGENHDGEPENLTKLDIRIENGKFTVAASGEGTVEKILYNGSETVPTAPGTYPVTCAIRLGNETVEFQIGTFVVPEPKAAREKPDDADVLQSPLYRVTGKDGKDISYKAEQKDGVLTITVDADFAALTGTLNGISTLKAQGVKKIVFATRAMSSAFLLSDLLEKGKENEPFKLNHDGKTVSFTVGEKLTDVKSILTEG